MQCYGTGKLIAGIQDKVICPYCKNEMPTKRIYGTQFCRIVEHEKIKKKKGR